MRRRCFLRRMASLSGVATASSLSFREADFSAPIDRSAAKSIPAGSEKEDHKQGSEKEDDRQTKTIRVLIKKH